jgi:hypothetical protein
MHLKRMIVLAALVLACDSKPPIEPLPDLAPPTVTLLTADRDADGLIELEVTWFDADGPLLNPPLQITSGGTDLLTVWDRRSADAVSLRIEETVTHLLPAGEHDIIALVKDSSGKTGTDTAHVTLAHLTKLGSVAADVETQGPLVACGDSTRVFLGGLTGLLSIDAVSLTHEVMTNPFRTAGNFGAEFLTCAQDEPALYMANGLQRFDVRTRTWSARKNESDGYAIARSTRRPEELFVGESYGHIGVYDRSGLLLTRFGLPDSDPVSVDAIVEIETLPGDQRIFVTQFASPTYMFDADWRLIRRLQFSHSSIATTTGNSRVFGTTLSDPGIVELNPVSGDVIRAHDISSVWRIDVRPDNAVAFITTVKRIGTSIGTGSSLLIDLRNGAFREIERVPSSTWYGGNAAWLPAIKRLVVYRAEETGSDFFDVYLDRS